jgi:transposase
MIYCGIDCGSREHEVLLVDEHKKPLGKSHRIPESRAGHQQLLELLRTVAGSQSLCVAFEATGVYYQNLVHTLAHSELQITFYRLNPYAAKQYAKSLMRRQHTDKISAKSIAWMIVEHRLSLHPYHPQPASPLSTLCSEMLELKKQLTVLLNRLHKELFIANPELSQTFSDLSCAQSLALLARYPTAAPLARAHPTTIARVRDGAPRSRRIGEERALALVRNAQRSVASDTTPHRAHKIQHLVKHIRFLKTMLKDANRRLHDLLAPYPFTHHPPSPLPPAQNAHQKLRQDVLLLDSIPGIDTWSAAALLAFIEDLSRFDTFEKLNAFIGTCPAYIHSGINTFSSGTMSKQGSRKLRWLLYMVTLTATKHNPLIAPYYQKHLAAGKKKSRALAHSMTKMLRLIYGVLHTRIPFDPAYSHKRKLSTPATPQPAT